MSIAVPSEMFCRPSFADVDGLTDGPGGDEEPAWNTPTIDPPKRNSLVSPQVCDSLRFSLKCYFHVSLSHVGTITYRVKHVLLLGKGMHIDCAGRST